MTIQDTRLLIATTNDGKFRELSSLLSKLPYKFYSLNDLRIGTVAAENGSTLEENAKIKAETYSKLSGMVTLADDSGLEVDVLNGEPGVLSSRYAGPDASDSQMVEFLLQKLENIPDYERGAKFRCVIAITWPFGPTQYYKGECSGRIVKIPRGGNGFGYDPVFLVKSSDRTMAELSECEKNRVSHRALAIAEVIKVLKQKVCT